MAYVIAEPCVDIMDKSCIRECPVDCIYEGNRMMYINPEECIDCGACEAICPMEAIFYVDEVPPELNSYTQANRDFFDGLELPGGAKKAGKLDRDPEFVLSLPSK
ncbi:ferredoxin [Rhodococcus koreensis]|uniref:ferredoxin n=1 Tax=Rhodococcus koreensis TaxID=99653 RepID=UPI0036727766